MRLALTARFQRAYWALETQDQERADKALRLLARDLRHPSLHVKKIQGTQGPWEAPVSRSIRLTFGLQADVILLRNIGGHDETLDRP